MLALRLKEGESILIGDGLIRVKYVERVGNQICIGIEAPRELKILREQVAERIRAAGK